MSNYVPTIGTPISLGTSPEMKAARYTLMGLASVGVVAYYWKHKNPWVAGLYSIIALGYVATASDYREEAHAASAASVKSLPAPPA